MDAGPQHLHQPSGHDGHVLPPPVPGPGPGLEHGAGALAASPFSGWCADRFGHRFTLASSLGIEAGLLLLIPHVHSMHLLFALLTLQSAATQAYWPASMAVITDLVPAEDRKQAFVLHRLATNLGIAVGPALGGWVAQHSFPALFWIDGGTTLAGMAVVLAGIRHPVIGIPPAAHATASGWRDRRLILLLLSMVPAFIAFTQIHGVLSLWVCRALGHGTQAFGLLFTLDTLLVLLAEAEVNRRLAHWPHGKQLALGSLLFGLGFGSLYFFRPMPLLALSSMIWTFGEMVFLPASSEAVAALAPPDRRGQYLGLYSLAYTAALALGAWLGLARLRQGRPALGLGRVRRAGGGRRHPDGPAQEGLKRARRRKARATPRQGKVSRITS